jgi:hypothetical protein
VALLRHVVGTLVHPERTLTELAGRASLRHALGALLTCGLAWAALSAMLYADGHVPRVTSVPIRRTDYYLWQALFVVPLLICLWLVLGLTSHGVSRLLGGPNRLRSALSVLAFTYAVPVLVLFVLPDALIYALFGFETLGRAMRFYASLAPLATLALTALGIHIVYDLGLWRASAAALVGLVMQALPGALLLR